MSLPLLIVQCGSLLWGIGCHPRTPAHSPFWGHVPHGEYVGGRWGKPVCKAHKDNQMGSWASLGTVFFWIVPLTWFKLSAKKKKERKKKNTKNLLKWQLFNTENYFICRYRDDMTQIRGFPHYCSSQPGEIWSPWSVRGYIGMLFVFRRTERCYWHLVGQQCWIFFNGQGSSMQSRLAWPIVPIVPFLKNTRILFSAFIYQHPRRNPSVN